MLAPGPLAGALHGGLTQGARARMLGAFKDGRLPVLVATVAVVNLSRADLRLSTEAAHHTPERAGAILIVLLRLRGGLAAGERHAGSTHAAAIASTCSGVQVGQ